MGDQRGRVVRWSVAVVVAALLLANFATVGEAKTPKGKVEPALLSQAQNNPKQSFDVIVRATQSKDKKSHASKRASDAIKSSTDGKVGHGLSIVGGVSATLSGTAIVDLAKHKDIAYISRDLVLKAHFDPLAAASALTSPGLSEIGVTDAWTKSGVTGRGVGVAVIDSGIADHPDLAGRIVAAVDFTTGTVGDTLTGHSDPGGHGTHVAGLIGGDGTASAGAYTGVAPGANLIDVRVIGATGTTTVSTVLRGMQWVIANRSTYNIRVANLSLGATEQASYTANPLATGVEMLTFAGITVVVAAGNGGPAAGTITTPGDDPFVITVGAIDDNGTTDPSDDLLTSWSSQGATLFDGLAKPDLAAPGRKMVSLRAAGSTLDTLYPDRQVSGTDPLVPAYFRLSGTSMSAPVIAGTVALMLEKNPSLRPAQIKHRLRTTATPVSYGSPLSTGAGVVNVAAAVAAADPASDFSSLPVSDGFATATYAYLYGQTLSWRDLTFNGGVDTAGTPWANVDWTNIQWNDVTWQDMYWESMNWQAIAWQDLAWEDAYWETSTLNVNTLGSRGGWVLVK